MKVADIFEAKTLGSKIEFVGLANWKESLPANSTFHKDGQLERAQARGKDFEGVAGTFNHNTNKGWIYAYYTKKENLVERVCNKNGHE